VQELVAEQLGSRVLVRGQHDRHAAAGVGEQGIEAGAARLFFWQY